MKKIVSLDHKGLVWLWSLLVIVFVIMLVQQARQGLPIETNILELLPEDQRKPELQPVIDRHLNQMSQRLLFLIGDEELNRLHETTAGFAKQLQQSGLFKQVTAQVPEQQIQAFSELYFPHRGYLLADEDLNALRQHKLDEIFQQGLREVYSPLGYVSSATLTNDPVFLFKRFLMSRAKGQEAFTVENGFLTAKQNARYYHLVSTVVGDNIYGLSTQRELTQVLESAKAQVLEQSGAAEVLSIGAFNHAAAGVAQGQREISTVGTGSIVGVILLLMIAFRSMTPMFLSLTAIAVGAVIAFVICMWVFGEVHLMALVLGASLIGVSVDYSFHYFSEIYSDHAANNPSSALQRVLPGISLGLITSVIAYLAVGITPFPAMQQIAVFSAAGLVAAYACVLFWFPLVGFRPQETKPIIYTLANQIRGYVENKAAGGPGQWFLVLIILIGAAPGLFLLHPVDDIKILQSAPKALLEEESRFKSIAGADRDFRFFLLQENSPEKLLQLEESLVERLQGLVATDQLKGFEGLTRWIPSVGKQTETHRVLMESFKNDSERWDAYFESIGLTNELAVEYRQLLEAGDMTTLSFEDFQQSPLFQMVEHLWIGKEVSTTDYSSVISLSGLKEEAPLQAIAADFEQVHYVNQTADLSTLFGEIRMDASRLVVISYSVILLLLILRYGIAGALQLMAPPVLAAAVAMSFIGYVGEVFNLFNVLALVLVLGIGIDYTLFFKEGSGHRDTTMLAVLLSALTTLLAFGLLGFSKTQAIHGFGLTLAVGIIVVFFLAPIFTHDVEGHRVNND